MWNAYFPIFGCGTISVVPARLPRLRFDITIKGRSGHGAMPHYAVDPIYVGAKVVDALQSIASRETNAWIQW